MKTSKIILTILLLSIPFYSSVGQVKSGLYLGISSSNIRHNVNDISHPNFLGVTSGLIINFINFNTISLSSGIDIGVLIANKEFKSTNLTNLESQEYLALLNQNYFISNAYSLGIPLTASYKIGSFSPYLGTKFLTRTTRYTESDMTIGHTVFNFSGLIGVQWITNEKFSIRLQYNRALNKEWTYNQLQYTTDELSISAAFGIWGYSQKTKDN